MNVDMKNYQNLSVVSDRPKGTTRDVPPYESAMKTSPDPLRGKPNLSMVGLLLVEMIIGYEWLVSGVVKVVKGDFPSGLADELLKKSEGVPSWYAGLIKSFFIPNAAIFGYLIEISEVLAGIALVFGSFIWLCGWDRCSDRVRRWILFFIISAAIGTTFLVLNLHIANGAPHPWLLPDSGFDEGVDLDSVLPAIQIVIAWISIDLFRRLGRKTSGAS